MLTKCSSVRSSSASEHQHDIVVLIVKKWFAASTGSKGHVCQQHGSDQHPTSCHIQNSIPTYPDLQWLAVAEFKQMVWMEETERRKELLIKLSVVFFVVYVVSSGLH